MGRRGDFISEVRESGPSRTSVTVHSHELPKQTARRFPQWSAAMAILYSVSLSRGIPGRPCFVLALMASCTICASTKPGNTKMDQVNADEKLYTDCKDDKITQVTNLKFKTNADRMSAWVTAHKGLFPDPDCRDYKTKFTTLRVKESASSSLTVKFYVTTG